MADIEWKALPEGLWTPPAVFADVGNLCLQAFTDDGVPTWEICKKKGRRGEWHVIAKGTADSFEAAKAAALFEAEAASRVPRCRCQWRERCAARRGSKLHFYCIGRRGIASAMF
jgi:hypothetical protein